MGGPSSPSGSTVNRTNFNQYMRYLPQLLQTGAASQMNMLNQYGNQANQFGQNIQGSNLAAGAGQVGSTLTGQGGQNVLSADALNRQINPEYYANRAAGGQRSLDLLNSINLNGLSPGEANAIERSTNQGNVATGNLGNLNATNTISNAMNFGNAISQKRAELGNALNTNSNFMNGAQTNNFGNVMQGALMQPPSSTQSNFGLASLPGGQATSQSILGSLNNTTGVMQPINYQTSLANSAQGWSSQIGSASGSSSCCFIFLEIYNGRLPWYVRLCRDRYYAQEPQVAIGYKRMAQWLVPLMRRRLWISKVVNILMVKPITQYGGYLHRENKFGWLMRPVKLFWFWVWRNY